jgi:hypothetical protein
MALGGSILGGYYGGAYSTGDMVLLAVLVLLLIYVVVGIIVQATESHNVKSSDFGGRPVMTNYRM